MPTKTDVVDVEKAKRKLGALIAKCRKAKLSLRQLAQEIDIPPSNMKYIEAGVNCPTAEVYSRIIRVLNPTPKNRKTLDQAYMDIRNTPPPDVCDRVKNDPLLIDVIRTMDDTPLTDVQAQQLKALLCSFAVQNTKGEHDNG